MTTTLDDRLRSPQRQAETSWGEIAQRDPKATVRHIYTEGPETVPHAGTVAASALRPPVAMGNSGSRVTAQDKAILDLKLQRDRLHQYQRRITVLTNRETEIARQMLAKGDKKRALLALRRKKYQESLLAKTDGQLEQLEKLTSSVEFALIQKDVVFGLQQGTHVLQEIHREMGGIAHVEKLMGETAEAIAYQDEVSEMLGGRMSNADEDEVEDELAALEAQMMPAGRTPAELAPAAPVQEPMPNAPDTQLVSPEGQAGTADAQAERRRLVAA
ncbi:snf7 family protein [Grosmannia clavigera kw1407]|uniref:Snf7 family protein n=1 Tax=Grosmannia clavigera (strain kw1407 / UAMH 11150) TaxID=655863 RepID=F0XTK6_GROCL|nr:snf7 family protein [Grosmannia clavigera kw1407]EFW98558.1 snf7 family protein [Grosmannia clavigera kw1407]